MAVPGRIVVGWSDEEEIKKDRKKKERERGFITDVITG